MDSKATTKPEDKKTSRARYDHLRAIEHDMQSQWYQGNELGGFEMQATPDYEKMTWEEKNDSKYMVTFPYPYMNGFLHLGKYKYSIMTH